MAVGKGVLHPPEVEGPGAHPDAGAYQAADAEPWRAGCTFSPLCAPPPPAPPVPCEPPAGASWRCKRGSYCGPKHSFYYSGALSLADCSTRCVANSSGCSCFDHDDADDQTVEGIGGTPTCRLHASGADIISNEESSFTAYWQES